MTQPISTNPDRLDHLWRSDPGTTGTQPLPVTRAGDDSAGLRPRDRSRMRRRRAGRGVRLLLLELVLAVLVSAGVAAAMGWRVLSDLSRVVPGTGVDPFIELWSLAWSGHALKPGSGIPITQVFDGNAFYPADYSLAFTDSLLGYGPITWFFHGTAGLITAYNLIFVFAPALSSLGAYALARQLGAHPVGAAVAGAGFAYAPWHFAHFSHLHVLSTGPLVIALAMLARGHGLTMSGRWTPTRPPWVLLGWLVAAWQLTIGFANGLPFAYLLAVIGVLTLLVTPMRKLRARQRQWAANKVDPLAEPYPDVPEFAAPGTAPAASAVVVITPEPRTGRLILADVIGATVFAAVGAVMAFPYLRVEAIDPQAVEGARGLEQIAQYSPKPIGLLTPPAIDSIWSWLSDGRTLVDGTDEARILPGVILIAFAVLGLAVSSWRWWWRVTLLVVGLVIAALCLGSRLPDGLFPGSDSPFVLLWRHVPGWAADRTPGRLIVFLVLALALLAAGAVSRLCGWGNAVSRSRGGTPWLRIAVLSVLPILIVLEGWSRIPVMPVPPAPAALTQAEGPMVVLPSLWTNDSKVMFWTATRGFPALGNGQSGITPTTLVQMRAEMVGFPDERSVNYLRQNGFRSVVVLRADLGTDLWKDADRRPKRGLGLTRRDLGDSVLYTVGTGN